MPYFFQIRLKQKMIAARYTNHPLVSISSQKKIDSGRITTQDRYPNSAGMAYFFQTSLKQKAVAARYTNYHLISIPSQNRFLIGVCYPRMTVTAILLVWPTFFKLA